MLVTFSSPAAADVMMFGDVARRLLETLGKEATARGVLMPEEYPQALQRLGALPPDAKQTDDNSVHVTHVPEVGVEPHELVGLRTRAQPFVWMIQQADEAHDPILWEAEADFFTDQ